MEMDPYTKTLLRATFERHPEIARELCKYLSSTSSFTVPAQTKPKWCTFCKHNLEPSYIYYGHCLKNAQGIIECPILRKYTCPICGVSGDDAHTVNYCPEKKRTLRNRSKPEEFKIWKYQKWSNPTDDLLMQQDTSEIEENAQQASWDELFKNFQSICNVASATAGSTSWYRAEGQFSPDFLDVTEKEGRVQEASKKCTKKTFCNFCANCQLPIRVVKSHNVRDEFGNVECRFLKSRTCSICWNKGHIKSYCPKYNCKKPMTKMFHI